LICYRPESGLYEIEINERGLPRDALHSLLLPMRGSMSSLSKTLNHTEWNNAAFPVVGGVELLDSPTKYKLGPAIPVQCSANVLADGCMFTDID